MLHIPHDILKRVTLYTNKTETSIFRISCSYFYKLSNEPTTIYYKHLTCINLIDWAREYSHDTIITTGLSRSLAKYTHLLKYISDSNNNNKNPCPLDKSVYNEIIVKGYLESLIWITNDFTIFTYSGNRRPLNEIPSICCMAAQYGHLHILQYIFAKNETSYNEYIEQFGVHELYNWKNMPLVNICEIAATCNWPEIIRWSFFYFDFDEDGYYVYKNAIKNGNIDVLNVLYEHNIQTDFIPQDMARSGFIEFAISYDQFDTLVWLWNNIYCYIDSKDPFCEMILSAYYSESIEIKNWIRALIYSHDYDEITSFFYQKHREDLPKWLCK